MVEFKEMTVNDAAEVAKLYNELVCFIRNETGDEYFNIDTLPEAETEKQLKESLENPALITFVAKDNGNVIAFISGEIRKTSCRYQRLKRLVMSAAPMFSGIPQAGDYEKIGEYTDGLLQKAWFDIRGTECINK